MFLYEQLIQEAYEYTANIEKPADFDHFWEETHSLCGEKLDFSLEKITYPLNARVYKASLIGYGDTNLSGWYLLPPGTDRIYPAVLVFHGYRGYASSPLQFASYLLNGFAVLAFDLRGQVGKSGDNGYQSGAVPGWMNQGLDNPHTCYYRRLAVDCLRMVDLAKSLPDIDGKRLLVTGSSQGGGLALLTAALSDVALCIAGVPNMCYMEYGVLNSNSSLREVMEYLRLYPDKAPRYFQSLRYFDNLLHAENIRCPVLISVGMQDQVCLPKTIFATFNKINAPKKILPYPFSGHDGGGALFGEAAMRFALEHLKP